MIDELFQVIEARKLERPTNSYTVKLFEAGTAEIARKVGEEALEVIVAALSERDERLLQESADLIYHLLVLLSSRGLSPDQVYAVLTERRSPGEA
jgi:phosphoribosyl-ATP pyrophosphohydrolase/phosphoribosyl-AMP cyclohydrolase